MLFPIFFNIKNRLFCHSFIYSANYIEFILMACPVTGTGNITGD
jgi:hypothetical protein